jgi:hypothetical protein
MILQVFWRKKRFRSKEFLAGAGNQANTRAKNF